MRSGPEYNPPIMQEQPTDQSVEALLDAPELREAGAIELSLFDVIHFRLLRPGCVFELVEQRLLQRDPEQFRGYAAIRGNIESAMQTASSLEKVEACCFRNSKWAQDRSVLHSTELEVWMDLSYANPWALQIYRKALVKGKTVYIRPAKTFPARFFQVLLQKNGFERIELSRPEGDSILILLGFPRSNSPGIVHFIPELPDQRPHFIGEGKRLGERLAAGVIIMDRERQIAVYPDPKKRYLRDIGYRLIGPSLVLMMQAMAERSHPVALSGEGSAFLNEVIDRVRPFWSWLPEVHVPGSQADLWSILPQDGIATCLFPAPGTRGPQAVIQRQSCNPPELMVPVMHAFTEAALSGPKADVIQAGTRAFIEEFAHASRGLKLEIGIDPVMQQWRQQALSPKEDFIRIVKATRALPGMNGWLLPWQASRLVRTGPWPTGTYLSSNGLNRLWIHAVASKRVAAIQHWQSDLAQNQPAGRDSHG